MVRMVSWVLVALVFVPALAEAQDREAERRRALTLFAESHVLYDDGRYEEAAELLRVAYGIYPEPILLFNRGLALARAGDSRGALAELRRYLDAAPDAENRGEVLERIAAIERSVEEAAREEVVVAPPEREVPPPRAELSVWPWIVAGLGAALMIAGVSLGVLAGDSHARADAAPIHRDAVSLQSEAEGFAIGANIGLVGGGVALGIGIVWGIVDLTAAP